MHTAEVHSCCRPTSRASHSHSSQTIGQKLLLVLEKVSLIGLAVFSAYLNLPLFIPFTLLGIAIGIYMHSKKSAHPHTQVPSCSQGLMEQLTGNRLPPALSLLINVAVMVCHIEHHSEVFVPIVAVFAGSWIGKNVVHYSSNSKKVTTHAHS